MTQSSHCSTHRSTQPTTVASSAALAPHSRHHSENLLPAKQILLIDNYDSFTYNLVQYLGALNVAPVVWRNDAFSLADIDALQPAGVVISPGPCTPCEAGQSVDVVRYCAGKMPVLGVCLGHQSIGQAYGARVVRAKKLMHGKTSTIVHDGSGIFAGLPEDTLTVTRYHSLVIEDIPEVLLVNAWCFDEDYQEGEKRSTRVVMGVRHREHPVWGVQFHPESILTPAGQTLLANFLAVC